MSKIVIFIVSFLLVQAIFWILRLKLEISSLKTDKQLMKARMEYLESNMVLKEAHYKAQIERLTSTTKIKPIEIPKGTIEAVRYAMIHNHPDNGGDAEKFILYKNCYDKLTGGR